MTAQFVRVQVFLPKFLKPHSLILDTREQGVLKSPGLLELWTDWGASPNGVQQSRQADLSLADPSRVKPSQADPIRSEPSLAEPSRAEGPRDPHACGQGRPLGVSEGVREQGGGAFCVERVRPRPLCCFRICGARWARLPVCPVQCLFQWGSGSQGLLLDLFAALCYSFMVREKVRLELGLQDYFV